VSAGKTALVAIDVQNDFVPGGALAVPGGDRVVDRVNSLMGSHDVVILTQDWHPENDPSFENQGGPWPPHCVIGSKGAELHPDLDTSSADHVVKASVNDKTQGTDLIDWLREQGVETVTMAGLALDYCVRETALSLAKAGFKVKVDLPATRAVAEDTAKKALADFQDAGIAVEGSLQDALES